MKRALRRGRLALLLIGPAMVVPAVGSGGVSNASTESEPVVVGDLAYFTGHFSEVVLSLAAQVDFPIQIINEDPPLGRPWDVIHEDIGTSARVRRHASCSKRPTSTSSSARPTSTSLHPRLRLGLGVHVMENSS